MSENYAAVKKLKELFDSSSESLKQDYWTEKLLQVYSETLGQRILWKWQSLLSDLESNHLHPSQLFPQHSFQITDWGCGPGTASLALAQSFPKASPLSFEFRDRSPLAVDFSKKRLHSFTHAAAPSAPQKTLRVLLLSYVISELGTQDEEKLWNLIQEHDIFLWVDAGSHTESRRLTRLRNLLAKDFHFLFPCPHQNTCPLSGEAHTKDWCHRFAKAPSEVFQSAEWAKLSKELMIDLRSLPYMALYAVKHALGSNLKIPAKEKEFLGRPRLRTQKMLVDFCKADGSYSNDTITKRTDPELYKKLRKL